MPRDGKLVYGNPFLLEEIKLGSLVRNTKEPDKNALVVRDPEPGRDYLVRPGENPSLNHESSLSATLNAFFSKFFSLEFTKSKSGEEKFDSRVLSEYVLRNPNDWFQDMCVEGSSARKRIEKHATDDVKLYLIVGFEALQDASRKSKNTSATKGDMNISVPPEAIGAPPATGAIVGDIGTKSRYSSSSKSDESIMFPGDRVYTVKFQRVKWRTGLFGRTKQNLEDVKLSENPTWKMYSQSRGQAQEAEIECWLEDEDDEPLESIYLPKEMNTSDENTS